MRRPRSPYTDAPFLVTLRERGDGYVPDRFLPAATWYEKHDISTTDMHPFVHSFNPAIAPPWETRTDFDAATREQPRL